MPPARRYVILAKIDESIEIDGKEEILYSNICKNYISEGYKRLESFEKVYNPVFNYQTEEGIKIEKQISMVYGKNIVCIYYKVENTDKDITMKIAPVMNYRDFHCMNTNHEYQINQKISENKARITVDGNKILPIYLYSKEGKYIEHQNDTFKNMFYVEEEKRGFYPEEDLFVPGRYEIDIKANSTKEFTIVCGLEENIEEIDGKVVIQKEKERIDKIVNDSKIVDKKQRKSDQEKMR